MNDLSDATACLLCRQRERRGDVLSRDSRVHRADGKQRLHVEQQRACAADSSDAVSVADPAEDVAPGHVRELPFDGGLEHPELLVLVVVHRGFLDNPHCVILTECREPHLVEEVALDVVRQHLVRLRRLHELFCRVRGLVDVWVVSLRDVKVRSLDRVLRGVSLDAKDRVWVLGERHGTFNSKARSVDRVCGSNPFFFDKQDNAPIRSIQKMKWRDTRCRGCVSQSKN